MPNPYKSILEGKTEKTGEKRRFELAIRVFDRITKGGETVEAIAADLMYSESYIHGLARAYREYLDMQKAIPQIVSTPPKEVQFSHVPLVAFLLYTGHYHKRAYADEWGRVAFVFEDKEELLDLQQMFEQGKTMVEPGRYSELSRELFKLMKELRERENKT